jgi:hypothetical protein
MMEIRYSLGRRGRYCNAVAGIDWQVAKEKPGMKSPEVGLVGWQAWFQMAKQCFHFPDHSEM